MAAMMTAAAGSGGLAAVGTGLAGAMGASATGMFAAGSIGSQILGGAVIGLVTGGSKGAITGAVLGGLSGTLTGTLQGLGSASDATTKSLAQSTIDSATSGSGSLAEDALALKPSTSLASPGQTDAYEAAQTAGGTQTMAGSPVSQPTTAAPIEQSGGGIVSKNMTQAAPAAGAKSSMGDKAWSLLNTQAGAGVAMGVGQGLVAKAANDAKIKAEKDAEARRFEQQRAAYVGADYSLPFQASSATGLVANRMR